MNEDIVRNLTLKVDPRLADALVAHAKGERVLPKPDEVVLAPAAVAEDEEAEEPGVGWEEEGENKGDESDE